MNKKQLTTLAMYNKPTSEILRNGLQLAQEGRTTECEFIRYKACFSHFIEAKSVLNEFSFKETKLVESFYNEISQQSYLKILINDLTYDYPKLNLAHFSKTYKRPIYENLVNARKKNGEYICSISEMNNLLREQYNFSEVEWGISENLILLLREGDGFKINCFLARIPARNLLISLRRLFSNLGAVLMANDSDQMYNLSITKLLKEESLYPDYKAARWYFIDKDLPQNFIQFLTKLGAVYKILPYEGKDADYVTTVIEDLTQILTSEK